MKALRRNPADLLVVALVSVGALSVGLVSLVGFDLISELSGPLMIWSRSASAAVDRPRRVLGQLVVSRWAPGRHEERAPLALSSPGDGRRNALRAPVGPHRPQQPGAQHQARDQSPHAVHRL